VPDVGLEIGRVFADSTPGLQVPRDVRNHALSFPDALTARPRRTSPQDGTKKPMSPRIVDPSVNFTARPRPRQTTKDWSTHLPRTMSIPFRIWANCFGGSFAVRSVRYSLSTATICDALATDSFGRPETRAERTVFPGAVAQTILLVTGTQTTVPILLRFRWSPCTTTTGLRNPGPEPPGSGSSAHQTSPWAISTTRYAPEFSGWHGPRTRSSRRPSGPGRGSSLR
jgi:hypothetical protein